jgi:hypothetical protein
MKKKEKMAWLKMWLEIDEDGNNKMEYTEYLQFFNISDSIWVKRTFQLMNYSFTGVVTFVELVTLFLSKIFAIFKIIILNEYTNIVR